MEIKEYFSTTKEKVEAKEHNIFVAICLGNKFFTKENIREYLKWALKYTKDKVLLFVADKIQVTNYNVRNNSSKGYNLRRVLRDGAKIKFMLKELVAELPKNKQDKIKVIQWEEYEKSDKFYNKVHRLVYKEFRENKKFKNEILKVVKTSVVDREFSEEEYLEFCNYVLDEFSLVYSGTLYDGDHYGMFFYPNMDSVAYFFEELKKENIFPELIKKLPKEKVALVILN